LLFIGCEYRHSLYIRKKHKITNRINMATKFNLQQGLYVYIKDIRKKEEKSKYKSRQI